MPAKVGSTGGKTEGKGGQRLKGVAGGIRPKGTNIIFLLLVIAADKC